MGSPSIIPNDRLDRDFYLVLEEFRGSAAFRETDEGVTKETANSVPDAVKFPHNVLNKLRNV
jgi:hypothetical protein